MLERAKRASHIDPPASSYAIMRRARSYRGENPAPGKDVDGELDPTPGIREQPGSSPAVPGTSALSQLCLSDRTCRPPRESKVARQSMSECSPSLFSACIFRHPLRSPLAIQIKPFFSSDALFGEDIGQVRVAFSDRPDRCACAIPADLPPAWFPAPSALHRFEPCMP
jgi:hypothetical protein